MIDIHTHILPFVDDGSESLEKSLEMVVQESNFGVTDIILTPHYRFDFKPSKIDVESSFSQLVKAVKEKGLNVNLYLGQEIFVDRDIREVLREQKVFTINHSSYVLIELDVMFKQNLGEMVYELKRMGYIPIVAHVERYFYADIEACYEIKRYGGLIQVNASSLVGKEKRVFAKLVKRLFKYGLVDFVASDVHFNRVNQLDKCYALVKKKYGGQVADKVFTENAKKIIKG